VRSEPTRPASDLQLLPTLEGSGVKTRLVSVVVPLVNEEATISRLYDEVRLALDGAGLNWEIVYVDDGSTDGSYRELVRLHAAYVNVRVVRLRRNFGKAAALSAGFEAAQGDVVITMDADLQDDPAEIPALIAKLEDGFDLVSGWKADRKDPFRRRLVSHIYNGVSSLVTGVHLHDMNCGLKAYRAEVLKNIRLYGELHRFVPVLAHHLGYAVTEIPVHHRPRLNGRSRYGLERYLRGFFDLLTVAFMGRYRRRPLHLFGGIGFALTGAGSVILMWLTIDKIGGASIGGRPLLLLGILLVVVGIQFFSLGLVGELLTSHHEEKAQGSDTVRTYVREVLR
jgi:glycosyltransferase involved in cell wall biosynthesis